MRNIFARETETNVKINVVGLPVENDGLVKAIQRSQAVIEFDPNGTILTANDNFLNTMGYTLDEVKGRHHSMFVEPREAQNDAYREFWAKLRRGEYDSGAYKRIGKGGREVWIQASYNPVVDSSGHVIKVVKFASDITRETERSADFECQLAALNRTQGVIEFDLDGKIKTANPIFLD